MSDDIEAIVRRAAAEEAQQAEERRRESDERDRPRRVWDLFRQLECFENGSSLPGEEVRYADLLIRLCREARDAGLASGPPGGTPSNGGERLALEVLRLAFAGNGAAISNLLRKVPKTLGSRLVPALLDLVRYGVLGGPAPPADRFPDDVMFQLWLDWIRLESNPGVPVECVEWPEIRHFGRILSGHATFNNDTWEWLLDWLEAEHNLAGDDLLRTKRAEVVRLLRVACGKGPADRKQSGRGRGGRGKRNGPPKLEKRNPAKFQIYQRIKQEHEAGVGRGDIPARLKADRDFVEQVKEAKLTLNKKLVNAAFAFFAQPSRK
jgi:hypothetical protein